MLGSLGFCRTVGDEQRWLAARIGLLVDSASGRPGISASLGGWVPYTHKRWKQFCDDTVFGLTKAGFRMHENKPTFFSAGRWIAGITSARARKQADLFDAWLGSGARAVQERG